MESHQIDDAGIQDFCGIVNLDHAPLRPETMHSMMSGLAGGELSCFRTFQQSNVIFATRGVSPRNPPVGAPEIHSEILVVADGRVDNREELCGCLNLSPAQMRSWGIEEFVRAAYQKWGNLYAKKIRGSWCAAIWSVANQELTLSRDVYGPTNLYYIRDSQRVYFSTTLEPLLRCPEYTMKPDLFKTGQLAVVWPESDSQTIFQDTFLVPPATTATFNERGVQMHRYLILEDTPLQNDLRDEEYEEEFRQVFWEAVRCRMPDNGSVAVTLSGGLDSGSVAAVAAELLKKECRRLKTFSSVPLYGDQIEKSNRRFCDEQPYISELVSHAGNIDPEYLRVEDSSPLQSVKNYLAVSPYPVHAACNLYWLMDIFEKTRDQGLQHLMVGQGGNATISWHGIPSFTKLVKRGQWLKLTKDLRVWSRLQGVSLGRAFIIQVLLPLLPNQVYGSLRKMGSTLDLSPFLRLVNPDFLKSTQLEQGVKEHHSNRITTTDSRQAQLQLLRPQRGTSYTQLVEVSRRMGFRLHDPTTDQQVVKFQLSVPENQYLKDGQRRSLIRRAMKGVLPDKVRLATSKGRQAGDILARLQQDRDEFQSCLETMKRSSSAQQMLNLPELEKEVSLFLKSSDPNAGYAHGGYLMRFLQIGLWMAQLEARQTLTKTRAA